MSEDLIKPNKSQLIVLPAFHGDCMIVKTFDKFDNPFTILIDGGTVSTFEHSLKKALKTIPFLDIVVLTHIDSDHIGGLIKYVKSKDFKGDQIGRYWMNLKNLNFITIGDSISYNQAKSFEEILIAKGENKNKCSENIYVGNEMMALPKGIKIEILSPTLQVLKELNKKWPELNDEFKRKLEDISVSDFKSSQLERGSLEHLAKLDDQPEKSILQDLFNSSSIAFVLTTFDLSILFLADSHPSLIKEQMGLLGYSLKNKLKVDLVKVSHHGSKNNTMNDVLDMIECDRFIISTNGGSSSHTHPDRETIARIIHHPERVKGGFANLRTIYLNYAMKSIENKAGKFVAKIDFETGNWQLFDKVTIFENE